MSDDCAFDTATSRRPLLGASRLVADDVDAIMGRLVPHLKTFFKQFCVHALSVSNFPVELSGASRLLKWVTGQNAGVLVLVELQISQVAGNDCAKARRV